MQSLRKSMLKARFFIIGLIVGLILGGGITWASMRYCFSDENGNILGTSSSNPVYVTAS